MQIERCGGPFWSNQEFGALWIMADDSPINGVQLKNIDIRDSTFSGIMFRSETHKKPAHPMQISFENVTVTNTGAAGVLIRDAIGTATFKNTKLVGVPTQPVVRIQKPGSGTIQLNTNNLSSGFE